MDTMKFKHSLFGFKKSQVMQYMQQLQWQHENDKAAVAHWWQAEMQTAMEKAQAEQEELRQNLNQRMEQCEELSRQHDTAVNHNQELDSQNRNLSVRCDQLENAISKMDGIMESVKEKHRRLEQDLLAAQDAENRLRHQLEDKERYGQENNVRYTGENDRLLACVDVLVSKNNTLLNKIASLEQKALDSEREMSCQIARISANVVHGERQTMDNTNTLHGTDPLVLVDAEINAAFHAISTRMEQYMAETLADLDQKKAELTKKMEEQVSPSIDGQASFVKPIDFCTTSAGK